MIMPISMIMPIMPKSHLLKCNIAKVTLWTFILGKFCDALYNTALQKIEMWIFNTDVPVTSHPVLKIVPQASYVSPHSVTILQPNWSNMTSSFKFRLGCL